MDAGRRVVVMRSELAGPRRSAQCVHGERRKVTPTWPGPFSKEDGAISTPQVEGELLHPNVHKFCTISNTVAETTKFDSIRRRE
jgi:hypothetical protein